ncbi:PREDICTED: receptor-like protein 12 [Ipomoea nil]|uniref:receptor-like protein 12 n=1 Tax=Ipomoea nil TaxID=35883 RepID=UPI000901E484|nr:PREDICTED: receptor-like protein 12 [Ipomoea nil]
MKISLLSWIPLICLLQIILGIDIIFISGQCQNDQISQLLQLRTSLKFESGAPTNKLATWNQSTDCCHWHGVKCDNSSRVISLSLDNETIVSIDNSSSLFSLPYIEELNMGFNSFNSSPIPVQMYNLANLRYLNLSNAGFGGQIRSSIGALSSLVLLNLSHNALTGKIPREFGNLTLLESLDLSANQFSGEIPVQLTELSFLSFLNLSVNEFSGKIPTGKQFQTFSEDSFRDNPQLCGLPLNRTCTPSVPTPHSLGSSEVRWEFVTASLGFVVGLSALL